MDQNSQPTPQPPYGNMATSKPKKKKTGLIVGITLGVLAIVAIIAALLTYFLWWQNPEKMVTDAVSNAIVAKKAAVNGKIVANMKDSVKLELNVKANSASDKVKSNIDAKLTVKDIDKSFSFKGDVVVDGDGTVYVKIDNLKDSFSEIFELMVEEKAAKSGFALSKDQRKEYRDEMLSQLEPVLDKFNGKWMKISSDDLKNDDYKCYTEALKKMRSDEGIRKEIAQLYRKNNFLDIKDTKLSDRNGGRGFEIKGNRDKFSKFAEQLKDSSVGKDMSKCKKIDNETGESSEGGASLKLWASGFSHELKAIEFKGRDNDTTIEASLDIDMNKASEVEIPLDSTNMKELLDSLSLL